MDAFYNFIPNANQLTLFNHMRNRAHGLLTPAMHATTKTSITSAAFVYEIGGKLYSKAAVTAGTALSGGAVADDYVAVLAIYINSSGALSFELGDAVALADEAMAELPDFADTICCVGAIKIKNESGSTFTIGTDDMDTTGVTTTYYSLGNVLPNEII